MSVEEERKYDGAYLDTHLFTAPPLDLAPLTSTGRVAHRRLTLWELVWEGKRKLSPSQTQPHGDIT